MNSRLLTELRALFVGELEEHVSAINASLLALERSTSEAEQEELFRTVLRTLHTVKGAARAASLPVIELACHSLEDVFAALRAGGLTSTPDLFGLLFATTDALADLGERVAAGRPLDDAPLHALIPQLRARAGTNVVVTVPAEEGQAIAATIGASLRIPAERLDELLARSGQLLMSTQRADADRRVIATEAAALDEAMKRLRMVPFRQSMAHLERAARDVAVAEGKQVEFVLVGGEIEVDRAVLDALRDPLLHLVRNAVDHGIEAPDVRRAAGRSAHGTVTVSVIHLGADMLVSVSDDGRGLDLDAIRAQLRTRGLAEPTDDRDLARSIFMPGLTTAAKVTEVSGRGVGLDIVKTAVDALRGTIEVSSVAGTAFALRVPLTLSTLRVLEVSVAGQPFVIPAAAVHSLRRIGPADVHTVGGIDRIVVGDRPVPLVPMTAVLALDAVPQLTAGKLQVVVISYGTEVALIVDHLVNEGDVVVKGLGPRLRGTKVASGATLPPSGKIVLILDVPEVVRRALGGSATAGALLATKQAARKQKLLLIDDSVTTRTLEKSILEGAGYTVVVAVDGAEGWRLLQETPGIDLVISDVEMPKMDGFALTETIRASPRFLHLPVILVTGLAKPEDRARGLTAGANAYLVKSDFDQQQLLTTIEQIT